MQSYVVCSSTVKELRSSFTEGLNTYRVQIIRLKDRDANQVFRELEEGLRDGKMSGRLQMVSVLLTPLMGGDMPQEERFRRGFRYLKNPLPGISKEENSRMQAVLYAFAVKFLDRKELEQVKEELSMTILGEMLVNDGMEKGAKALVETYREFGVSREDAVLMIMQKLAVSKQKAEKYLEVYW